ncbi:MAG: histone deacetylase [Acidobacteriota bacterium]
MSFTGLVHHSGHRLHETGASHPERPERVTAILERLTAAGVMSDLDRHQPAPAALEDIEAVHDPAYVRRVAAAAAAGETSLDSPDTTLARGSFEAARLAVGGALEAADRLMDGRWRNAFVACRPPGHHAEANLAMGFCLFNNVAVTAAYLRRHHGVERVAIVDWDVHHGNGTQHAFDDDPQVYYASLHQWPLYPGTGRADERGRDDGFGATLNCPMAPGDGDEAYRRVLEETVLRELDRFAPQVVLLSAGFDAHAADPLSATRVTEAGYRQMTRTILSLARQHAGGRVLSLLEGGYDLEALAASVLVHVEELLGKA